MDLHTRHQLVAELRAITEPVMDRLGYDLVAVELGADSRGTILQIYIDRPGGVSIADCSRASRAISPVLDVEDPLPGNYVLEVGSPGMDRPVQRLADFERFTGWKVRVKTGTGKERRRLKGVLRGLDDGMVLLEIDTGAGPDLRRLPFDQVDTVHLDLEPEEYEALGAALPPLPEPLEGESPDDQ